MNTITIPRNTTAGEIRRLLGDAPDDAKVQARARRREPGPCWCGCGGETKSRFVPGHDAKLASRAKRVARGELDAEEELAKLPVEEARAWFLRHVAEERPKHEAREAAKRAAEEAKQAAAAEETEEAEAAAA